MLVALIINENHKGIIINALYNVDNNQFFGELDPIIKPTSSGIIKINPLPFRHRQNLWGCYALECPCCGQHTYDSKVLNYY
jgi:hypothetical protein